MTRPTGQAGMRVGTASDAAVLLRVSRDRVYELAQLGPHRGGGEVSHRLAVVGARRGDAPTDLVELAVAA